MIELRNIAKSFGSEKVLENIHLSISTGETQVLLGLSGSGKTTLLKLINGLLLPDVGEVLWKGIPLNKHHLLDLRRQMGYVIQKGGLFPHYTVFQNVCLIPQLIKWSKEAMEERYQLLMSKLGLDADFMRNKYPHQLSGGQIQRVGIARALAAKPSVLLMDEPFGALDPITRNAIRKEFAHLDELKEKTVVLVTHDVQEAFELGDRIALIHKGHIIQNASPMEILANPHPMVKDFIEEEWLSLSLKKQGLYDSLNDRLLKDPGFSKNFQKLLE